MLDYDHSVAIFQSFWRDSGLQRVLSIGKGVGDLDLDLMSTQANQATEQSCNGAMEELTNVIAQRQNLFRLIALRYLGNLADAEDAVQDAFLSAVRHLKQFKRQAQLSTWLTAIVTNSARMKLRQRRRFVQTFMGQGTGEEHEYAPEERLFDHRPNPEEICQRQERTQLVIGMATQLSPVLREAFRLRDMEGLSVREAAKLLGVSSGTVKAQTVRARTKLQRIAKDRMVITRRAAISAKSARVRR